MNERIKELAEQATQKFSRFGERDSWEKLFAELIVRECADIAFKSGSVHNKSIEATIEADRIYHKIKKQFGVEE